MFFVQNLLDKKLFVSEKGISAWTNSIDRTVDGFHARVVQHECDHLWGILYPMRIEDMTQFGFEDVLMKGGVEE